MRNIWRIRNPKIYFLYNIVMSLLQGLMYYIEYINERKNEEVQRLSLEALQQQDESQTWIDTKNE